MTERVYIVNRTKKLADGSSIIVKSKIKRIVNQPHIKFDEEQIELIKKYYDILKVYKHTATFLNQVYPDKFSRLNTYYIKNVVNN